LTNIDQSPKLGRVALIALADWVRKRRDRSSNFENHGVEDSSSGEPMSLDQNAGDNGNKSAKECEKRGGECE